MWGGAGWLSGKHLTLAQKVVGLNPAEVKMCTDLFGAPLWNHLRSGQKTLSRKTLNVWRDVKRQLDNTFFSHSALSEFSQFYLNEVYMLMSNHSCKGLWESKHCVQSHKQWTENNCKTTMAKPSLHTFRTDPNNLSDILWQWPIWKVTQRRNVFKCLMVMSWSACELLCFIKICWWAKEMWHFQNHPKAYCFRWFWKCRISPARQYISFFTDLFTIFDFSEWSTKL